MIFRKQRRENIARRTYVFYRRTDFICLSRYTKEEGREGRDKYRDCSVTLTSSKYRLTSAIEFIQATTVSIRLANARPANDKGGIEWEALHAAKDT